MTGHKVKVTRKGGTADGWEVRCFAWSGRHDPNPSRVPLIFDRIKNDYIAECDLPKGMYSITADLTMGVEIEIDLTPSAKISQPRKKSWPVKLKVPATMTRDIFPVYFHVEGEQ